MKFSDIREMHPCEVCGRMDGQRHHIVTRGSGGDDDKSNLMWLCAEHHVGFHSQGRSTWAAEYPEFSERIMAACERAGRVIK